MASPVQTPRSYLLTYERVLCFLQCASFGFLVTAFAAGRNAVWLAFALLAVLLLVRPVHRSSLGRTATVLMFIAVVALHCSPLDVCVRGGDALRVSLVPILHEENTYTGSRALKEAGFQENVDFVVYRRIPVFPGPKGAILITIPTP